MKYRAVTSHHIEVVTSNGESHELAIEYKPSPGYPFNRS